MASSRDVLLGVLLVATLFSIALNISVLQSTHAIYEYTKLLTDYTIKTTEYIGSEINPWDVYFCTHNGKKVIRIQGNYPFEVVSVSHRNNTIEITVKTAVFYTLKNGEKAVDIPFNFSIGRTYTVKIYELYPASDTFDCSKLVDVEVHKILPK